MKNRGYRDTFNLYKDFRQGKKKQEKPELSGFRVHLSAEGLGGGGKSAKFDASRSESPRRNSSVTGTSFPFKKSQNIQTPEAQGYKGLRRTDNVQM